MAKIFIKKKNRGKLHKQLGVPEDEKIPASKLEIKESDSAATKKRKIFAKNSKKWNKKAEDGIKNIKNLPQVEIKSISPRQQAYNDSLRRYNASQNLLRSLVSTNQPLQDSANVAHRLYNEGSAGPDIIYNNQPEADRRNALLRNSYRIDRYMPALETRIDAYRKMNKYIDNNHKPTEVVTIPQVEVGVGGGSVTVMNDILTFKKPLYNPSEHIISLLQPKEVSIPTLQQSINPRQVPNEMKTDLPGYAGMSVIHIKDKYGNYKPTWIEDKNKNRQVYGEGKPFLKKRSINEPLLVTK